MSDNTNEILLFSASSSFSTSNSNVISEDEEIIPAVLMYEGEVEDNRGRLLTVTKEKMVKLAKIYKKQISKPNPAIQAIKKLYAKADIEPMYAPLLKDHDSDSVDSKLGHVLDLDVVEANGLTYLIAKFLVFGKENIYKAKKVWKTVSISVVRDQYGEVTALDEVSYVVKPAFHYARSFSAKKRKPNTKLDKLNKQHEDVKIALESLKNEKDEISAQLSNFSKKKKALDDIWKFVKAGDISVKTFKYLALDIASYDAATYTPFVRAVKSVASSRILKYQFSSEASNRVMESFFDNAEQDKTMSISNSKEAIAAYFKGKIKADNVHKFSKADDTKMGADESKFNESGRFTDDDMMRMKGLMDGGKMEDLSRYMCDKINEFSKSTESYSAPEADDADKDGPAKFSQYKAIEEKITTLESKLDGLTSQFSAKFEESTQLMSAMSDVVAQFNAAISDDSKAGEE